MSAETFRPITLLQPPRIAFGPGCSATLPDEIAARGVTRVLLLTTPPVAPHARPLVEGLMAKKIIVTTITDVPPEPGVKDFEKILSQARQFAPDGVVGFGGGSVLDVAKLVAAMHDRGDPVQHFFGIGLLPKRTTYLACLPTTAGTGSEVSPNAILLDEAEQLKKGVISPWLVPDAAYVDPLFTLSVPPAVTAATGIDAMVHCIEAYANRFAHPLVDIYALEGIRLISANLEQAVKNGTDVPARTAVALGSLYGGLCLGPVNTAAVHALAYPLGSEFHIAHGLSNALLLAPVLRFNLPAAPQRYAKIAVAIGAKRHKTDLATAEAGIEKIEQLCAVCGVPRGLQALNIPESAIPRMAAAAMKVTRLLKNNPREVTLADAEAIYRKAFPA
ncbi:MAG: iron-containing alcohol dehydrogenase [Nibricoccus sp.]